MLMTTPCMTLQCTPNRISLKGNTSTHNLITVAAAAADYLAVLGRCQAAAVKQVLSEARLLVAALLATPSAEKELPPLPLWHTPKASQVALLAAVLNAELQTNCAGSHCLSRLVIAVNCRVCIFLYCTVLCCLRHYFALVKTLQSIPAADLILQGHVADLAGTCG